MEKEDLWDDKTPEKEALIPIDMKGSWLEFQDQITKGEIKGEQRRDIGHLRKRLWYPLVEKDLN